MVGTICRMKKVLLVGGVLLAFTGVAYFYYADLYAPNFNVISSSARATYVPVSALPASAPRASMNHLSTRSIFVRHSITAMSSSEPTSIARAISTQVMIPTLMYHHIGIPPVGADPVRVGLTVSPEAFAQQLAWLEQQGFHSITFEDLYLYRQGKETLPTKPIILSFDDGYDDAFTNGLPLLKQYGFIGNFAIITQWPGTTLGTNTYATWQQITEARQQGMWIVSHTQNHFDANDPKFTYNYILNNLHGSITDLQKHLGITTNIIVYPYGHYNEQYLKAAIDAGFVVGVTTRGAVFTDSTPLMEVPRFAVRPDEDLASFAKVLNDALGITSLRT